MRSLLLSLAATLLAGASLLHADDAYKSPYSVKYTFQEQELVGDLTGPRGDWKNESEINYRNWSSPEVLKHSGGWGPAQTHYAAPANLNQKSADWMRQRVIATALRLRGYSYQHHHIPDWEPAADAPAKSAKAGEQGKGLDCSNFTAFAYNQALGIKPSGGIKEQAEMSEVPGPGPGHTLKVQRIELPSNYADYARVLKTGDLLFIKGKAGGEVTHVVLWVGSIGVARSRVPLILDSTGEGRKDDDGAEIPNGIQLRPFSTSSWYYHSASHAIRIIADRQAEPASSTSLLQLKPITPLSAPSR